MRKIKLGIIGVGNRGKAMMKTFLAIPEYDIVAVSDVYEDRMEEADQIVRDLRNKEVKKYSNYLDLLHDDEVEAVFVASSWNQHISQAIDAMKAKKIVGIEVGGAYTVQECWDLVKTYEETKTPIMMMENCCYDRFELLSTSLVRRGLLGEIVHCKGAYGHDIRDEVIGGHVNRHYRLDNYLLRNCENYPTHELGPIARLLNINRGNRMTKLVSVASKARGMAAYALTKHNPDPSLVGVTFNQGDIVNTIITCENGETISLTLDTTLPKYYSREFTVRGTKGMTIEETNMVVLEDDMPLHEFYDPELTIGKYLNNANNYSQYLPSYWRNITEEAKALGHGGMDYYMCKEFAKAIINKEEMPIDVYDAASWMVITALSADSIAMGGAPVAIPDFTNGKWTVRKPKDVVDLENLD